MENSGHRSFLEVLRAEGGLAGSSEILPYRGLYIGSAMAAKQSILVSRLSHILTVNGQPPLPASCVPPHLTCVTVDIEDDTEEDILKNLPVCFEVITAGRMAALSVEGGPGGVLVHCTLGVSRSATICAAYIMCTSHIPAVEALSIVRAARRWVRPNDGFLAQLRHLEDAMFRPSPIPPPRDVPCEHCTSDSASAFFRTAFDSDCELCNLRRTTVWHAHVHPLFIIIDCESCSVPMLVMRGGRFLAHHGRSWAQLGAAVQRAALAELSAVADARFGPRRWNADWLMRSSPDHPHVHARPYPRGLPAPPAAGPAGLSAREERSLPRL